MRRTGRTELQWSALLDPDDVTAVNDTLGHTMGDRLLTEIAGRPSAVLRPTDTVARLGGDEFAILLDDDGGHDLAGAAGAHHEGTRGAVHGRRRPHTGLRVSVGAATVPVDTRPGATVDVDAVLAHADIAKHVAKQRTGGRFERPSLSPP